MPIQRQNQITHPNQAGFTLVEVMVVVAVMGILAVIATPSMTSLINNSRVTGQTEELVTSLQLARAEAVRRNVRITVCPTDGSNTIGTVCAGTSTWANWAALNLGETTVIADRVLRNNTASGSVQVSGPAAGIVFKPSGMIDTSQQLQVAKYDNKRCLTVLVSGVVTVNKGACS